jgi:hypothetical protein
MKSSFRSPRSACLKSMLVIVQLAFFGGPILVKAGQRDSSTGPIQPELSDRAELRQGYLLVYSATDRFDDGGTFYYLHSSCSIYTTDGKFFKNVENHISRSDEIPALVTLPAGSYTILLRSENRGCIRLPIVITAGGDERFSIRTRHKRTYRNGSLNPGTRGAWRKQAPHEFKFPSETFQSYENSDELRSEK